MSNLNCPTCGVHIDEHPANRCLGAWVAEVVMEWSVEEAHYAYWYKGGSLFSADVDQYPHNTSSWCPSRHIAAAWEVVMHLVRKHYVFALTLGTFHNAGFVHLHKGKGEGRSSYKEDNEGCLAILRAAIKARNV